MARGFQIRFQSPSRSTLQNTYLYVHMQIIK